MNHHTGIMVLLFLLLLSGASFATAAQVSPSYLTGIPAVTPSQGTGPITASHTNLHGIHAPIVSRGTGEITSAATAAGMSSMISAPPLTGFVSGAGSHIAPIQGGDFRAFVNPYWSVASVDGTYPGSVITTCPL